MASRLCCTAIGTAVAVVAAAFIALRHTTGPQYIDRARHLDLPLTFLSPLITAPTIPLT